MNETTTMMTSKFQIGDMVEWQSQAHGHAVTKMGQVIVIVPEGIHPYSHRMTAPTVYSLKKTQRTGIPRKHESYIVKAHNGKRQSYYWPIVSKLHLAV